MLLFLPQYGTQNPQPGGPWVKFGLTSDQDTVARKTDDNDSDAPKTLYAALKKLEESGKVRTKVAMHKVTREASDAGDTRETYKVENTGPKSRWQVPSGQAAGRENQHQPI